MAGLNDEKIYNDFTVMNISYYVECHSLSHSGIISNSAKNSTDGSLIKGLIDGVKCKQFISTYSNHNRSYKRAWVIIHPHKSTNYSTIQEQCPG